MTYLYVIENTRTGLVKIGYSQNPKERCRTLQTGNADPLKLIHQAQVDCDRARLLEKRLHMEINHCRELGEWFNLPANRAQGLVDYIIIRWHDDQLLDC